MLAGKGATVYVGARDVVKGQAAVDEIREATGSKMVHLHELDLADLKAVKRSAAALRDATHRLDCPIMNAGVMVPPLGSETKDGLELQMGTNVVAHIALFEHLKPLLLGTAKGCAPAAVRVVILSSNGHELAPPGGVLVDDHKHERLSRFVPPFGRRWRLYGQSKLGNIVMCEEIARRHGGDGLLCVCCNPGAIKTELARHLGAPDRLQGAAVWAGFLLSVERGALTQLFLATSPALTIDDGGNYFIPIARRGQAYRAEASDSELATRLWAFAEQAMTDADAKPVV